MLKFHPYSILTGETMVGFVIYVHKYLIVKINFSKLISMLVVPIIKDKIGIWPLTLGIRLQKCKKISGNYDRYITLT